MVGYAEVDQKEIEYVEEVSESRDRAPLDRRRYARKPFSTYCKMEVGVKRPRASYRGQSVDISEKGISLVVDGPIRHPAEAPVRVYLDSLPENHPTGERRNVIEGTLIRVGKPQADGTPCAVSFTKPLSERVDNTRRSRLWCVGIIALAMLFLLAIAGSKYLNYRWFWYDPTFQIYSLSVATFILTRIILSLFYKTPGDHGYYPSVSMIIAVKNEEKDIERTIDHCFRSAYPKHLVEVIVVDDGSTDGTWEALTKAHKKYSRLRLFRFGRNKGKRHAMALGAIKAHGEVLLYVDSDSFAEPESVYRIVQPLADPTIGAVAGSIQIIVNPRHILSKMERVRYYLSHRIFKACESLFGTVTCCPGAFSAYRRSAVLAVLPAWLNQTFMGSRATFGDDRSLTNRILSKYHVVFHHDAVCWTYAPETWSKFFRQQIRWKKSWSRETLIAGKMMWRKHPVAAFSFYLGVVVTMISPLIAIRALVIMPLFAQASCVPYVTGLVLINTLLCLYFLYDTKEKYWLWGLGFVVLYIAVLSWLTYYAMLTVNRTHWGTR